ncbi:alpha-D-ribose 1-methylphosphonate 5-triphosphate diphosphatase [Desulfuromusa kysingii]|uniref:Alpha-D-ribose 1-methylphosphonate 5-triphosphate diphosphatase n=1 Tax=Desulfuromusa kysingii TaxID=37625 RepID=A0A1H3ZWA3_9BACT|nr:phosphonate metabolism protein PhnM [Desulfuromusa kysingii]SEA27987.1 alpha-D-ribose 1-methylphosphonate 5-triphosphate diphosphatase [Desulfuromusa kysingii]
MPALYQIINVKVVTPDAILEDATVTVTDGVISHIAQGLENTSHPFIDAQGQYLLPGFIDLHCDAVEKGIEPRPGTFFPINVALYELDKNLASCGVTTMYHSLSFAENEVGVRSNLMASSVLRSINDMQDNFRIKTKVHTRFEVTDHAAVPVLKQFIGDNRIDLFSFMDHSPGQGQFKTISSFKEYFGPVYKKTDAEMNALITAKLQSRESESQHYLNELLSLCREHQVSVASHDDDTPEKISWLKERQISLSEFPINLETAQAAKYQGVKTLLGAPNIVRGSSQSKNLSAREAIAQGCGDILCSDYAPLTLVHAVFMLNHLGLKTLPEAVRMTSLNPALAIGMETQTGSITIGKDADLVLVANGEDFPRISRTFVKGQEVFRSC